MPLPKELNRETFIAQLRAEHARILRPDVVFAIEDGWLFIVQLALERIEDSLERHSWIGRATVKQIKEKFGELRIYVRPLEEDDSYPDALANELTAIRMVSAGDSQQTCEICGDLGETGNFAGYYQTLCSKHSDQRRAWIASGRKGDPFDD
ncbi:hypothetical protein E0J16_34110 [Rhizobium pisi]|uniref:hypothetical protein n=1 Tax=Rhizobium pisi TaxID=574561 RepID=UPI00103ED888|nr:hypothetical protein [Rhizobium pisi]TCA41725.1 hypothetical protein E0J16_34110 [Rhizobium pisi]